MIGRLVDLTADLERVEVQPRRPAVADHARVWARGMTVTDPAHVTAAEILRENAYQRPRPAAAEEMVRNLADYDRAFGLNGEVA